MTTNLETLVLNGIKYFQAEYADGVPVSILKLDLGLSDDDLKETLLNLEDQGVIFIEGERIKIIEEPTATDSVATPDNSRVSGEDSLSDRKGYLLAREGSRVNRDDTPLSKEDLDLTREVSGLTRDTSDLKKANDAAILEKEQTKDLTENLTEKEQQAFDLIKKLAGDSGLVSRHILEGNLLYGDLKLTNMNIYNLIMSLESKGIIKKIQRVDGEYYSL